MKSVKPGRGPSFMGGVMSIVVGVFGIFWTVMASKMGGGFFALFGILFVVAAIAGGIYNFVNAGSKNRFSSFDITEDGEEPDPLNQLFGTESKREGKPGGNFCPYCGAPVEGDHAYCRSCGKKL